MEMRWKELLRHKACVHLARTPRVSCDESSVRREAPQVHLHSLTDVARNMTESRTTTLEDHLRSGKHRCFMDYPFLKE